MLPTVCVCENVDTCAEVFFAPFKKKILSLKRFINIDSVERGEIVEQN